MTATLGEGSTEIASPRRVSVAGTTLDLVLEREGIVGVNLIKIDVEGFEERVLAGARKTLERDQPNLVFEYAQVHWERLGQSLSRVLAMLRDLGYEDVFHEERRGLRLLPSPPPSYTNIVVPRDGKAPLMRTDQLMRPTSTDTGIRDRPGVRQDRSDTPVPASVS